jgi:hypothetical protein
LDKPVDLEELSNPTGTRSHYVQIDLPGSILTRALFFKKPYS